MKVYVDELPSCCEDCVCHSGVSGRCKLLHRTTFDIPPRDCPLQSLADYTKQVRKEVCDKFVEEFMLEYTMGNDPVEDIIYNVSERIQDKKNDI